MGRHLMRLLGLGATLLGGYLLYRVVGRYDFDAAPPWRSLKWLSTTVELPTASVTD